MMAYRIANSIHLDRTEVYALLIAMAQMRTAFANLPMPPTGRLRSPMRTSPMLAAPVTQGGVKINRRRALVADSAPSPPATHAIPPVAELGAWRNQVST